MGCRVYSEEMIKCLICKQDETQNGVTTVTLERGQLTLVIKDVPARPGVLSFLRSVWERPPRRSASVLRRHAQRMSRRPNAIELTYKSP